jgi:hypothetical protein
MLLGLLAPATAVTQEPSQSTSRMHAEIQAIKQRPLYGDSTGERHDQQELGLFAPASFTFPQEVNPGKPIDLDNHENEKESVKAEVRARSEAAADPNNRIYVEYSGVLYPLEGWYKKESKSGEIKAERIFPKASGLEAVDPGRQIALSNQERDVNAKFIEINNKSFARTDYLLPAPVEANDLFESQLDATESRLGNARALEAVGTSVSREQDLLSRWKVMPNFGVIYDTGFTGGNGLAFDVTQFPLGNQAAAGQSKFISGEASLENVPLSLILDNQVLNVSDSQVQFYVEANNHTQRDDLQLEHIYGRLWDKDTITVGAGRTYSLFGTAGVAPATIAQDATLIGTGQFADGDDNRAQLRVQKAFGLHWNSGIAIEDPFDEDFLIPADGTKLTRWPSLSSNLVYTGTNPTNRLQFSGLIRNPGFEAADGQEFFATAWGVSAYARKLVVEKPGRQGAFFIGFAGGKGIGQYVYGISTSAAFDSGSFSALSGIGAYTGYRQRWTNRRGWDIASNLAYGYANMDTPAFLPSEINSELHQGWANLLVYPNKNLAVGMEYQYGMRETLGAGRGEDHRFMLVIAVTTKGTENVTSTFRDFEGKRLESISDADLEITPGNSGTAFQQRL